MAVSIGLFAAITLGGTSRAHWLSRLPGAWLSRRPAAARGAGCRRGAPRAVPRRSRRAGRITAASCGRRRPRAFARQPGRRLGLGGLAESRRRPRPAPSSSAPIGAAAAAGSMPRDLAVVWPGRESTAPPRRRGAAPDRHRLDAGAGWPFPLAGAEGGARRLCLGAWPRRRRPGQPRQPAAAACPGLQQCRLRRAALRPRPADRRDRHRRRLAAAAPCGRCAPRAMAGWSSAASRAAPGTPCRRSTSRGWWMAWWRWRRPRMARPAARPGPGRWTICGRWCEAARSPRGAGGDRRLSPAMNSTRPGGRAGLFRSLARAAGRRAAVPRPAGGGAAAMAAAPMRASPCATALACWSSSRAGRWAAARAPSVRHGSRQPL